ncbi:MAG: YdcF family protein [Spirosomaceae bacterium]|jgi:uncharacterized SAM-binding protein YcdF (DUF218 family)|nr:YdcF family protein [Spirosomataceae bacterium]
MFYILSKILGFVLMPIGISMILLIFSFITKNRTKSRRYLFVAIIFLYVCNNPFIVNELMLWWEVPPTSVTKLPQHDVGIVLTGGITNDDKLPHENTFLGKSADRAGQTIHLYKLGKIKKILISGGSANILGKITKIESAEVAKFMMVCGVKHQDILLDTLSKNTRENAIYSSRILKKYFPNQRYVLLTSGFHMKRSVECFEKVGVKVTPFGTSYNSHEFQFIPGYLLGLREDYFVYSMHIFHEIIGYLTYWVMGYV